MHLTKEQSQDKTLIAELASQIIKAPVTSVTQLGGAMTYNYEVNHHIIVKLPSERTNTDDWLYQSQYMQVIQDGLSFQIPDFHTKTVFEPQNKQPFVSAYYEKIEGTCIPNTFVFCTKDRKFKINFFEQLSDAVTQIHEFSPQKLPFTLPTRLDHVEKELFNLLGRETYVQKKLFRKLAHNQFLGLGKSGEKISILTHSDLHCGNVVLDDQNKLVGLLDFDTLALGDRFWEFHSNLYKDPCDLELFKRIYTERTNCPIDKNDLGQMEQFLFAAKWLGSLFAIYNSMVPKNDRDLKKEVKNKMMKARARIPG